MSLMKLFVVMLALAVTASTQARQAQLGKPADRDGRDRGAGRDLKARG